MAVSLMLNVSQFETFIKTTYTLLCATEHGHPIYFFLLAVCAKTRADGNFTNIFENIAHPLALACSLNRVTNI